MAPRISPPAPGVPSPNGGTPPPLPDAPKATKLGHSPEGGTLRRVPVDEAWSLKNTLLAGEAGAEYADDWARTVLANQNLIPLSFRDEAVKIANAILLQPYETSKMGGDTGVGNATKFITDPKNQWLVNSFMSKATGKLIIPVRELRQAKAHLHQVEAHLYQTEAHLLQAEAGLAEGFPTEPLAEARAHLKEAKRQVEADKKDIQEDKRKIEEDKEKITGEIKAAPARIAAGIAEVFPTPVPPARK